MRLEEPLHPLVMPRNRIVVAVSCAVAIFSVALTLRSLELDVAALTEYAGVEPTKSREALRLGDRDNLTAGTTYWTYNSGVPNDRWTLKPHWPILLPVLETIAGHVDSRVRTGLSIGTWARDAGYAFDILPEYVAALHRAACGIWIDSYSEDEDRPRPDDYPWQPGAKRD